MKKVEATALIERSPEKIIQAFTDEINLCEW
jgi:hypothetical protein